MSDDNLYQVEKILNKRLVNRVEEYYLRWAGYTSDDDSWEKEDDCASCYSLIEEFETTLFERMKNRGDIPKILELKKDARNEIKVLVEWQVEQTKHYFYSSVVQKHDPILLINFYEEYVQIADRNDEITHFLNSVDISRKYDESNEPLKITAAATCKGGKVFLISWTNNHEASIIDESLAKERYTSQLVDFYESHLLTE